MKKQFLSFILIGFPFLMQAEILTVSNRPDSPGQYTSISDAISAASAGDTIYVHGSNVVYPGFTVTKKLTIIGPGHKPQKQGADIATIGSPPSTMIAYGASGTVIMGFYFQAGIDVDTSVHNLRIQENNMNGINLQGTGHLVMKNVIKNGINFISYSPHGNVMVRNNIMNNGITGANTSTIEISNNFIYSNWLCFNCGYVVFKNNIIWGTANHSASINMTFLNNLAFLNNNDTLPPPGSVGSGNIIGNPMFVNFPPAGGYFDYSYDYHLRPGSPAIGAGVGGVDIGPYGGVTPFDHYGEPPVPQVFEFDITNPVIPSGGNLEIKITLKTKD